MSRYTLLAAGLLTAATGGCGLATWWGGDKDATSNDLNTVKAAPRVVTLTDAKRDAAGIRIALVVRMWLQPTRQVPGRVRYDDTRHVAIKAAADGVLRECSVKPGDRVSQGQTLAVLSSPEIGSARADMLKRRSDWELAQRQLLWLQEADRNLQQLVSEIERKRGIEEIESQFRGRQLGEFREKLLGAYARFLLAESLVGSLQAATEGAVAARTLRERSSERQAAEAAVRSACEQAAFNSRQQGATAEAAVQDARRRFDIAQQHLATLLGYDEQPAVEPDVGSVGKGTVGGTELSLFESRAPFAGSIESKLFTASERVKQGDTLLILADTSRLWVEADIREQDWRAVTLRPGQELSLEIPALPERRVLARLYYVGREVVPATNAVPLVAWVDNTDELLRPGLFVRVAIPFGERREVLAVPSAAVVEHEGKKFVFVPEGPNVYRRTDVGIGEQTGEWTEITEGLSESAEIVERGAFSLKSELLLEREE